MVMELAVVKIVISIIIVVLLSEVSKRVNPLLGGILSGLPLGVGLSVYFICYSEGMEFVIKSIPWGIAGLASSIMFCYFYLLGAWICRFKGKFVSMAMSSLLGFTAFFISGYIIRGLDLGLASSIVVFLAVFIPGLIYIKKIKFEDDGEEIKRKQASFLTLLFRGTVVGFIIIAITGVASIAGSRWSGVLSSFPSTLYSLLLVLHFEEGNKLFPSVIYGFSFSVSTLGVFYILCLYILPILGLNIGFVVIYILSFLYLYIFNKIREKVKI